MARAPAGEPDGPAYTLRLGVRRKIVPAHSGLLRRVPRHRPERSHGGVLRGAPPALLLGVRRRSSVLNEPIRRRKRGYILTMDRSESVVCSMNQSEMQEAR
eukprot:8555464-Pyramimonas_sp.AAC.1